MPFKSEKQKKFMYANKPEMAKEWEKESRKTMKPRKKSKKSMDGMKGGYLYG